MSPITITMAPLIFQFLLLAPIASANLFSRSGDEVASASDSLFLKESRIINGVNAEMDRFPYSVSIQDDNGHFCGGSLVGPDTVLTAAHCLGGNKFTVFIGSDDVDEGEMIPAKKVVEHPNYNSETDQYDIGLVFLESSTTLDITTVKLNTDNNFPAPGSTAYAMGWGDTDPGDNQKLSDQLLVTDVEVISNDDCEAAEKDGDSYKGWIYEDMLCTFTDGTDACQGDSGGPLIYQSDNGAESDVQVGVVSWGFGCAYLPGVFSRISISHDWIQKTVCEESNDQPISLCGTDANQNPTKTSVPSMSSKTVFPTHFPTLSPTEQPTLIPSMSSAPTGIPSASQSPSISLAPSIAPTSLPTISHAPTVSVAPSASHTSQPSNQPSIKLSSKPSSQPSVSPSQSPSTSNSPTSVPSIAPSLLPSNSPTMTTSPSMSSNPTESPAPTSTLTIEKADRGSSLLIPDASALAKAEEEASNCSNRIGHSFAIGAFMSSIISVSMVL